MIAKLKGAEVVQALVNFIAQKYGLEPASVDVQVTFDMRTGAATVTMRRKAERPEAA